MCAQHPSRSCVQVLAARRVDVRVNCLIVCQCNVSTILVPPKLFVCLTLPFEMCQVVTLQVFRKLQRFGALSHLGKELIGFILDFPIFWNFSKLQKSHVTDELNEILVLQLNFDTMQLSKKKNPRKQNH